MHRIKYSADTTQRYNNGLTLERGSCRKKQYFWITLDLGIVAMFFFSQVDFLIQGGNVSYCFYLTQVIQIYSKNLTFRTSYCCELNWNYNIWFSVLSINSTLDKTPPVPWAWHTRVGCFRVFRSAPDSDIQLVDSADTSKFRLCGRQIKGDQKVC